MTPTPHPDSMLREAAILRLRGGTWPDIARKVGAYSPTYLARKTQEQIGRLLKEKPN